MKKKIIAVIGLILLATTLIACGNGAEKKSSTSSTAEPIVSSSSKEETTTSSTMIESTPTSTIPASVERSIENTAENDVTPTSDSNETVIEAEQITSHDQAVQYLMETLTELNQEDILYLDWGNGENDKGKYFDLKLSSKEIQENGGSGTIGIYRIFANRTFELYPND